MTEPAEAAAGPLTVLSAGAAALARSTELDGALSLIVEAGAAATGAAIAALFSDDPDRSRLELLLTIGMSDDEGAGFESMVAEDPRTRSTRRRSTGPGRWGGRGSRRPVPR